MYSLCHAGHPVLRKACKAPRNPATEELVNVWGTWKCLFHSEVYTALSECLCTALAGQFKAEAQGHKPEAGGRLAGAGAGQDLPQRRLQPQSEELQKLAERMARCSAASLHMGMTSLTSTGKLHGQICCCQHASTCILNYGIA